VHLVQITLRDALRVDGGELSMHNCTIRDINNGARALHVLLGSVHAERCRFVDNRADGAVAIEDGTIELRQCDLHGNHVAGPTARGGAVLVMGGTVRIEQSRFSDNTATASGGTLQIDGGRVQLADKTELTYALAGRAAPIGNLIALNGGLLTYTLPAPLGTWVRDGPALKMLMACTSESRLAIP